MTAVGVTYSVPRRGGDCCGALHVHAGLDDSARRLATRVMASMPGEAPVVVNSAGCGAALKDYGHLLGTDEAAAFSHELSTSTSGWRRGSTGSSVDRRRGSVIVQDPCHLRHVQRAHLPVRQVLARVADVVELDDEGLCCGAGGAYSALAAGARRHRSASASSAPSTAPRSVLARRSWPAPTRVARCTSARAGVTVRHPIDIVAESIR